MELTLIDGGKPNGSFVPKCLVQLDNKKETFTSFVLVGSNTKTGQTTIFQYTDALTLGQAYQLVGQAFNREFAKLSISEQNSIMDILRGGQ